MNKIELSDSLLHYNRRMIQAQQLIEDNRKCLNRSFQLLEEGLKGEAADKLQEQLEECMRRQRSEEEEINRARFLLQQLLNSLY